MHRLGFALLLPALSAPVAAQAAWPQGSGPAGNWRVDGPAPPRSFSASTGENIVWRTPLAETGQGGIAIAGGHVFVATMQPWIGEGLGQADAATYAHAIEKRTVVGRHIDAHCLDAVTGELRWTCRIEGEVPSIYGYPFSDATSSSPCADERHAWFTNAGGQVVCFTHAGEIVWQRAFTPTYDGPFNKQFEPFLVDDPARGEGRRTFVHMEPFAVEGQPRRWHFLVGLDAATGAELWRSEDALTHYNAPVLVQTEQGPCVLHARGGPHQVPERPVGMSLTRITGDDAGRRVWRYRDPRGNHEGALQTMACDDRFAYWLLREPRNRLVLIDRTTGRERREISLLERVGLRTASAGTWTDERIVDLDKGVFPMRYSMIADGHRLHFLCYATAWGKPKLGAPWCVATVDPNAPTGHPAVRYVELPTAIERGPAGDRLQWRTTGQALGINSRGREVTGDQRSRWDGWDWVFNGSPTLVGDALLFTLASGTVYALDVGDRARPAAFVAINDLGPAGRTWSANSVSYANGRLYHRTASELLCIGFVR